MYFTCQFYDSTQPTVMIPVIAVVARTDKGAPANGDWASWVHAGFSGMPGNCKMLLALAREYPDLSLGADQRAPRSVAGSQRSHRRADADSSQGVTRAPQPPRLSDLKPAGRVPAVGV